MCCFLCWWNFLLHKSSVVTSHLEMLYIDFQKHAPPSTFSFFFFFLLLKELYFFLLTHGPRSDKLLWLHSRSGWRRPPLTQTHRGGFTHLWKQLEYEGHDSSPTSPPPPPLRSAVERKGSHPHKSVTSPQRIHLFYTQWLSLLQIVKIDLCFLWLQLEVQSLHMSVD